ncbi:hypothetical protein AB0L64_10430 [Kribbella sp. NPDC051936]|uniref:hypothetical protein n=1 Tax=Kribbella sp. NPDC051936 TaxID=3154946 RepID=UPI00342BB008
MRGESLLLDGRLVRLWELLLDLLEQNLECRGEVGIGSQAMAQLSTQLGLRNERTTLI